MSEGCIFCAIYMLRAPAKILSHQSSGMVIEPLNPVTEGHVLVIPRIHVKDYKFAPTVTADLMWLAATWAKNQVYDVDSNLITSSGPNATQSVEHLHVHIVPRRPGDGLHLPWTKKE